MRNYKNLFLFIFLFVFIFNVAAQKINRQQLVERHTITNIKVDSLESLSVGNGRFAFTVDATGLQSFPNAYAKGVPLGTQSEWGWHSFPNVKQYQFEDVLNMIYESKALRAISRVESSKETILMNWMKNRYNFFLRKKYNSSFIKIMMTKYTGEDNFADVILD